MNKNKLGIWYKKSKIDKKIVNVKNRKVFFRNLHLFGYRYFSLNKVSKKDAFVIKAFKRRFLPNQVNGIIDQKTLEISEYLKLSYKKLT